VEKIMTDTRPLSEKYLDMNISCPFLEDNRCLVYDVRPTSCSGHFSVSPPEWCWPEMKKKPVLHNIIPSDRDLIETTNLADARISLYQLTLPIMIHKLINEGALSIMKEIK
jgi:Fe-S-cluster containining protein